VAAIPDVTNFRRVISLMRSSFDGVAGAARGDRVVLTAGIPHSLANQGKAFGSSLDANPSVLCDPTSPLRCVIAAQTPRLRA
jgi:hypothetical protein